MSTDVLTLLERRFGRYLTEESYTQHRRWPLHNGLCIYGRLDGSYVSIDVMSGSYDLLSAFRSARCLYEWIIDGDEYRQAMASWRWSRVSAPSDTFVVVRLLDPETLIQEIDQTLILLQE